MASEELMEGKMNSYGKTWHVWNTGAPGVSPDELPLGEEVAVELVKADPGSRSVEFRLA